MIHLRVTALDTKRVRVSGISPMLADCLFELPDILARLDTPAARDRLFPAPTIDDARANDDWQAYVTPELRHLFHSAGETVAQDLTQLGLETEAVATLQVTIAAAHVDAWVSALNQARLILGALHNIEEKDMSKTRLVPHKPKSHAIAQIHMLGYLLQLFVELQTGSHEH